MEEQFYKNTLATLLEYSRLLKLKRGPEASLLVKEAIEEEKNIELVIGRIKQIDHEFRNQASALKKKESLPEPGEKKEVVIKKTSFIKYFFSDRKELIQRSYEVSFYDAKFFGLKFHLSEEGVSYLQEILDKTLNFALPMLKKILEESWQVLEPHRYNVFYYLHQLFKNFSTRYYLDKKKIKRNLEFVNAFAEDLFLLLQHAKYLRYLKEGIYIYFANNENQEMVNLLVFIENLLDKKKHFSLVNYVVMTYSIFYRTNFSLKKIIALKETEEMEESKFVTTQKVRYIMQKSIQQLKSNLESNERKLFPLQFVQNENLSFIGDLLRNKFQKDFTAGFLNKDMLGAVLTFVECFLSYGEKILTQDIVLIKEAVSVKSSIFSGIWNDFILTLRKIRGELNYFREKFSHFHLKMEAYKELKLGFSQVNPSKEEEMAALVDMAIIAFSRFFFSLSQIMYNDFVLTNKLTQEDVFFKLESRKIPISSLTTEVFIPFADYMLESYPGESVMEVLNNLLNLSGTFLFMMEQKDILEQLDKKDRLMDENKRFISRIVKMNL